MKIDPKKNSFDRGYSAAKAWATSHTPPKMEALRAMAYTEALPGAFRAGWLAYCNEAEGITEKQNPVSDLVLKWGSWLVVAALLAVGFAYIYGELFNAELMQTRERENQQAQGTAPSTRWNWHGSAEVQIGLRSDGVMVWRPVAPALTPASKPVSP